MLTNDNIMCLVTNSFKAFELTRESVSMVAMPLFHIGGSGWAIVGMSRGGNSIIIRDLDPNEILRAIEKHGVTESFVVPAVLMFLLATPELSTTDVSSLKNICYGASPISEDILTRSMKALGCDFTQLYGLTETCGAITSLPPEDHDPEGPRGHLLRSAGKPFDHVSLRIVDPDSGATVSPGTVGEVWTRSDQNMLGYWQKADETAAVLTDEGWFHTGDAGWVDAEGYLFLHDRLKDMIVSGGENIYPAEVENILFAHPDVADAAVIGVPDDKWGETVKAIVVRTGAGSAASAGRPSAENPEASMQEAELEASIIAFARDRLAHYKCPTSVALAEVFHATPRARCSSGSYASRTGAAGSATSTDAQEGGRRRGSGVRVVPGSSLLTGSISTWRRRTRRRTWPVLSHQPVEIRYRSGMPPRRPKVGRIDDPIWVQDAIGPKEATEAQVPGSKGSAQGRGAPRNQRISQTPDGPRTQGRPRAPETSPAERTGTQTSGAGGATVVPYRVLMADPGMAAGDERECGAEAWLETDDGSAGLSGALRPLSVSCARPRGHVGHHRSKPKRALFAPASRGCTSGAMPAPVRTTRDAVSSPWERFLPKLASTALERKRT